MPKVLVVDDSLSVRRVVERALAARRIEVGCAASGDEAIDWIEREHPDAVVCDVVMPDRDGYEICRFVKGHARLAATPVLLMSGVVNDDVRERAARAGSDGVLQKPFAAEELVRRLERLLSPAEPPAFAVAEPAAAVPAVASPVASPPAPVAPPPALAIAPAADGATAILAQFSAIQGVQWAVLADRDGFVLEATTEAGVDADVAAALSACLAESSRGLGRELGRGGLQGMMLEYEKGLVAVYGVGAGGLLAVGMAEPSMLGKVRYYARKAVPELSRVL